MSACGGGAVDTRDPGEVAAQYQGPIGSTDVARGQELFASLCMSCHGGSAPALEGIGWEPAAMRQQIREGGGRMPGFSESRLSAEDLEALLAYMATNGGVIGGAPATAGGDADAPADGEAVEGDVGDAI
jgi:mono/diheme cytochrome c family protein